MTLKAGDRIRMILMDDPDPIPFHEMGTVEWVREIGPWNPGAPVRGSGQPWFQVSVKWDNGRTLMLSIPPDVVEVFRPGFYTVQRMRVLRVCQTADVEVEAVSEEQAIERAMEEDNWEFIDVEREVQSDTFSATLIPTEEEDG